VIPAPARYRLAAEGAEVEFTDLGATWMRARVPDRRGRWGDVVLGLPDPGAYAGPHPHLGSLVGRTSNRIAGAHFVLDGRAHALAANDPPHHLHGGPGGFARRRFRAAPLEAPGARGVRFTRESPHGEEGYPGRLAVRVDVWALASGALRIDYRAVADRPTPVGLTHHPYFNLRDGGRSSVLDHELVLFARRFAPVDESGIPTGRLAAVAGTPLDFRRPRRLGERLEALREARGGYDHPLVVDGAVGRLRPAATLRDPASGRVLELWTTLPALQLYSGQHLDGALRGHGGTAYGAFSGVCLEAQELPDAVHHPAFGTGVLRPGAAWVHTTLHRFGVDAGGGPEPA
jgi:aldose 1-epimerase